MDMSDYPSGRSPRRELQGPRPTPLRVHKDSHKIKKPPMAPQPAGQFHNPHAQPRPPVIIYTVSPKIIHANPNEFMSLVQRLTGPSSSSCTTSAPVNTYTTSASASTSDYSSTSIFQDNSGAISPAARFASIEKTKSPDGRKALVYNQNIEEMEIGNNDQMIIQRTGQFPGILSPNPNTLPPIPPNFFSPPSDSNPLNFYNDFSPILYSNRNYNQENSFIMPSPTMFSPQINMPSPNTLDLFNTLFDL